MSYDDHLTDLIGDQMSTIVASVFVALFVLTIIGAYVWDHKNPQQ